MGNELLSFSLSPATFLLPSGAHVERVRETYKHVRRRVSTVRLSIDFSPRVAAVLSIIHAFGKSVPREREFFNDGSRKVKSSHKLRRHDEKKYTYTYGLLNGGNLIHLCVTRASTIMTRDLKLLYALI